MKNILTLLVALMLPLVVMAESTNLFTHVQVQKSLTVNGVTSLSNLTLTADVQGNGANGLTNFSSIRLPSNARIQVGTNSSGDIVTITSAGNQGIRLISGTATTSDFDVVRFLQGSTAVADVFANGGNMFKISVTPAGGILFLNANTVITNNAPSIVNVGAFGVVGAQVNTGTFTGPSITSVTNNSTVYRLNGFTLPSRNVTNLGVGGVTNVEVFVFGTLTNVFTIP